MTENCILMLINSVYRARTMSLRRTTIFIQLSSLMYTRLLLVTEYPFSQEIESYVSPRVKIHNEKLDDSYETKITPLAMLYFFYISVSKKILRKRSFNPRNLEWENVKCGNILIAFRTAIRGCKFNRVKKFLKGVCLTVEIDALYCRYVEV